MGRVSLDSSSTHGPFYDRADERERAQQANRPVRPGPPTAAHEIPRRVLIVDDEAIVLYTTARIFEHLGFMTSCFTSPVAAIEAFRAGAEMFDLVVTDQTMPEMDGLTVSRLVAEDRPGLPVILISGYRTCTAREMADAKVRQFLSKPFGAEDMENVLREVLPAARRR